MSNLTTETIYICNFNQNLLVTTTFVKRRKLICKPDTYGEVVLSEKTCCKWFQCFKNGDFDVKDRHGGGKERIFEDSELEALLAKDLCQTHEELAESLEVTQQTISK